MISGHGTASTAVRAIKLGALDYIEKPLSYEQVIKAASPAPWSIVWIRPGGWLGKRIASSRSGSRPRRRSCRSSRSSSQPQRTIRENTVIYGLGLHSGTRTGMVLQPLPPDHGIHILTIPGGTLLPAHVCAVADTEYATTLYRGTARTSAPSSTCSRPSTPWE